MATERENKAESPRTSRFQRRLSYLETRELRRRRGQLRSQLAWARDVLDRAERVGAEHLAYARQRLREAQRELVDIDSKLAPYDPPRAPRGGHVADRRPPFYTDPGKLP